MSILSDQDRIQVKELVVAGSAVQIQEAMDTNKLRRKQHKALEIDHDAKEILFVVTTDTVDRDSERVLPKSFEKNMTYFDENPVVLYGHDHSIPTVGRVMETMISADQVAMRVKFATETGYPLAELLWNLYSADDPYMRMVSIGFIPLDWSDETSDKLEGQSGLTFTEIEPIELSLVNIGANRHALSALPAKIRNDAVLKGVYEEMAETPTSDKENHTATQTTNSSTTETTEGVSGTATVETIQMKEKKPEASQASSTEEEKGAAGAETTKTETGTENQGAEESGTEQAAGTSESQKIAKLEARLEKQIAKNKRVTEKNQTLKAKLKARPKSRTKGTNLGDYLEDLLGDGDDRADMIQEISDSADRSISTIDQIVNGEADCPDEMTLEAFSEVLDVNLDTLKEMAALDGCMYDGDAEEDDEEEDAEDDDDDMSMKEDDASEADEDDDADAEFSDEDDDDLDEKDVEGLIEKANKGNVAALEKMYYLSGMFEGSYEERQKLIHQHISDYLEYELDLKDEYWIDYTIFATMQDKILVYSYDKNQVYQIEYEIADNEIDFTSIQAVKLNYEVVDMDAEKEHDDDPDAETDSEDAFVFLQNLDPTDITEAIG